MYRRVVATNASTVYEILLAGIQFVDVNGGVCGGGALVVAVNLTPGASTQTDIKFGCNLRRFVGTFNYRHIPTGQTGTVSHPNESPDPTKATLRWTFTDTSVDPALGIADTGLIAPTIVVEHE